MKTIEILNPTERESDELTAVSPENIDVRQLPSVWFEDRNQLPSIAGIYFVLDQFDEVQYIGQSRNLKARLMSHTKIKAFKNIYMSRIAWLEISDFKMLDQVEHPLIQHFNPPLNVKNKLRYDEAWLGTLEGKRVICKLNKIMANKGLNQWDVSSATGIHWLTISQLYRNKFIKVDKTIAKKLCKHFNVEIEQMFEIIVETGDILRS